jgi:hypothetical protein
MGVCFYARTRQVHVPECAVVEDAEVLAALWADIDVAVAGEGGCAAEWCQYGCCGSAEWVLVDRAVRWW